MKKNTSVIDLFCGCGGFSEGFKQAGFKIKYGIDNWEGCKETYEYNHPETEFILSNIEEQNPEDFKGKIEGVIGSPPCPPFSNASNAKKGKDPDKGMKLVLEYLKWIRILKPKFWLMENVPGIEKYLKWRIVDFKIPLIKTFNSANYGVPQTRKRCFAGKYAIPKQTHSRHGQVDLYGNKPRKWVTAGDAISDIIQLEPNKNLFPNHDCYSFNVEKVNRDRIGKWQGMKIVDLNKPAFTVMENHGNTNLISSLIICNSYSLNNRSHRPYNTLNEPNHCITTTSPIITTIHEQKYTDAINNKEHGLDKPSKTIRQIPFKWLDGQQLKQKRNNQALFSNLRKFTIREQARLQSFPDSFRFFGSLSDQLVMVGNAVPPKMARAFAITIKSQIKNEEVQ